MSKLVGESSLFRDLNDIEGRIAAIERLLVDPAATASNGLNRVMLANDLSSVSSYTFSNLDGDTDRAYRIGLSGVATSAGADKTISIRPNSASPSSWFDSKYRTDYWDTTLQTAQVEYRGTGFGWILGTVNFGGIYGANHVVGEAIIEARRTSGSVRTSRANWSSSPDALTQRHVYGQGGGKWEDQASNITSLIVHFGGGVFTGDLWLERPFRAFI